VIQKLDVAPRLADQRRNLTGMGPASKCPSRLPPGPRREVADLPLEVFQLHVLRMGEVFREPPMTAAESKSGYCFPLASTPMCSSRFVSTSSRA
jgi:hypothetical protein